MSARLLVLSGAVHLRGKGRVRELLEPIEIDYRGRYYRAPAGFRCDGASIPFFLWWWCRPWDAWIRLAAVVHDYLYRLRCTDRRTADRIFLALLIHSARQSRWRWLARMRVRRARVMYLAVRGFGMLPYYT